ncbi:hypothetical protein TREMEDRAFT_18058, partial [Tremella mesenterica DSM 1558]|uniref:uncharacterized protein n=1 Tax=Tremella mesenterica (strain ATCC 24925 / CBS 8224 / DSM 1558 / NBRC 9311 / NRRL Y-6157 / RJB 2259-6 / UBC 559-6) TaxID=578456 RepID=UPI0003F48CDA
MSIACWIVVYTPQIWENYQLKSGEGLSVTFVVLWLLGDLTNLAGGIMANVLTTMILLAIYYALCDFILLFQVYYYRRTPPPTNDETTHLLSASNPPTQPKPLLPPGLEYPLLLTFVLGAGIFAWFLSDSHDEIGIPEGPGRGGDVELEWKSQTLGYISATLYLGSRIPQIIHNFKTRCAGLSLAMFFFTITGNITYAVSILSVSTDPHYILVNTSWLAGALLTIVFDLFVMGQFAIYSWQDRRERETKIFAEVEEEEE